MYRVDNLRNINEMERSRDPNSLEISIDFFLFDYLRGSSVCFLLGGDPKSFRIY